LILVGDCRARLRELETESVDAIVTDPPYELGFMGKSWDASGIAYDLDVWRECLRVLKPGGHLLAFSGSRTYHRMVVAIEDAGFEIRDQIMWLYGSGFPKSHNLDGAWQGWGTALKPAHEPICVARKPLRGTVAQNVLAYGTGAINVDGCRVGWASDSDKQHGRPASSPKAHNGLEGQAFKIRDRSQEDPEANQSSLGRWPANVIHDGSEEATAGLGEAARFFYSAKASKADRDEGLGHLPKSRGASLNGSASGALNSGGKEPFPRVNVHPTVKPTDLMRYLVRLVTPPGGLVLDPFTGSGSTGKAAVLEGMRFIGCELSPEYAAIAEARIKAAAVKTGQVFDIPSSTGPGRKADGEQLRLFA
jgi:site-specific DNA-methyltransferase (adenine-specific)